MKIAVIVPALNESQHIEQVIRNVPAWVPCIVVVDDGSVDSTRFLAQKADPSRVLVLRHSTPQGVGAAIAAGYRWASSHSFDIAIVMAGDGQMNPLDLDAIVRPIREGHADYVQGNRLVWPNYFDRIPVLRLLGIHLLASMTRLATGLIVYDAQCGYTAIGSRALQAIDWTQVWKQYGYPNDWLIRLQQANMRIDFVPVEPIYANEQSKMRMHHIPPIFSLLALAICKRALTKIKILCLNQPKRFA